MRKGEKDSRIYGTRPEKHKKSISKQVQKEKKWTVRKVKMSSEKDKYN